MALILPPLAPAADEPVGDAPRVDRRVYLAERVVGAAIGAVFALPAGFVLWRTFRLHASLSDALDQIPAPLWRTVQLAVLVSVSAAVIGTALAWLTVRTDLPMRRVWRVVLVLPLVLPSFVGAAAFITGLAPGGIIHDALGAVGVAPPRRFRGLGASWLVLTAFTYPYVLLPVSARLVTVRSSMEESARLLGMTATQAFLRVTVPQLRPAILGGSLLVFLYTLSEFGAVQLLGYDTLTRVIYATRQVDRSLSFSAASVLLVFAVVVVAFERRMRGPARPDPGAARRSGTPVALGWVAIPATLACLAVAAVGLLVPIASLATWARRGLADGRVGLGDYLDPAISTAGVAIMAAVVAVVVVAPIAVTTTRRPNVASSVAAGAVVGGFAIPGLVIALALAVLALNTPTLGSLYQTMALLIIAYVIHFGSQALASTEQAVRAVPTKLRESSRLLDDSSIRRFFRIDLPLMRPGLLAGGGLVMLATLKELPATLLLAPIGFSTLATEIWASFEEGFYAATGLASLVLIALSALLTWLLVLRHSEVTGR